MKKIFIFSLAALLTLACGSTYAQVAQLTPAAPVLDFKASGFFTYEYIWGRNAFYPNDFMFAPTGTFPTQWNKPISYTQDRARLMFNANMGKELSGTIFFEMDMSPWGSTPSADPRGLQRNAAGFFSADRSAVEVKWMYFDIAVPVIPIPITLRIGEQGFGPRPLVFSGDAAGISAGIKLDPVYINPFYQKALEGANWTASDDCDVYGVNMNAKLGTVTVGGYGIYYNFNAYPLFVKRSATVGSGTTGTVTAIDYINGTQRADFWYLGAYAEGKMGPVNINFDFVYDNGKIFSVITPTVPKTKYTGWASRLNVDYPVNQFNFGGGLFYASGDDQNNTYKKRGFYSPYLTEGTGGFAEAMLVYGSPLLPSGGESWGMTPQDSFNSNRTFGGTWFARVNASAQVTPSDKVTAKLYYIGDTTKNGNTYGTYVDKKTIGYELDLINTLMIYKNLKWDLGFGYMWAGDAMKFVDKFGTVKKPKDPWTVNGALVYNF